MQKPCAEDRPGAFSVGKNRRGGREAGAQGAGAVSVQLGREVSGLAGPGKDLKTKTLKPSRLQRALRLGRRYDSIPGSSDHRKGEGPLAPPGVSPFPGVCRGEEGDPAHTLREESPPQTRADGTKAGDAGPPRFAEGENVLREERNQPGDVTVAVPGSRYLRKPLTPSTFRGILARVALRAPAWHFWKPPPPPLDTFPSESSSQ